MIQLYKTFLKSVFTLTFGATIVASTWAADVPVHADDVTPLLIGQKAPRVTVQDSQGQAVPLRDAIAKKPTLLIFYRGGWCPYCNVHLSELRKIEQPLIDMGFQIIAMSPDQPKLLAETRAKNKLGYQLLSDSSAKAAKKFGLAYKVNVATHLKLRASGIRLDEASGQEHQLLPVPGAFLIDQDGLIHFNYVAPNHRLRMSNEVVLASARALLEHKK